MHRVDTGRLMTHISGSGLTVMGVVPAGKVWQVVSTVVCNRTRLTGFRAQVMFIDAGGVVSVFVFSFVPAFTGSVSVSGVRVNLAAGDSVVFSNANASTWDALVGYLER